jgi:hypothetical protein
MIKKTMSRYLYIAICLMILASCDKDGNTKADKSIAGRWKLVSIVDNLTNTVQSKPASITRDVELQFTFTSNIGGSTASTKTPTNEVGAGEFFVTDARGLNVGPFAITKVMETSWGSAFLQDIYSVHTYFFDNPNKLNLKTADKTLIFVKM